MRNSKLKTIIWRTLFVLLLGSCSVKRDKHQSKQYSQSNSPQQRYIIKHQEEAVNQMWRHGIPASITLAQGILETGSGKSKLARQHNNHFGIKCASSWRGKKTYATDNKYNECFRSYKSWQDSYEDHSLFLKKRRYHKLFNLRATDYKGWAKGLQKAGYATNPKYAKHLIALIERYDLQKFDRGHYPYWFKQGKEKKYKKRARSKEVSKVYIPREIFVSSGLHYVIAKAGDSFQSIAKDLGLYPIPLAKYNELDVKTPLKVGTIIYLEPKHKEAIPPYKLHIVEQGESMYSIAQRYGMQVKSLYLLNDKSPDYVPTVGDKLRLR